VAFLVNPGFLSPQQLIAAREAARSAGFQFHLIDAASERDVDAGFAHMAELHVDAMIAHSDPYLSERREQIIALAARYAIPALYTLREYVTAGGLMSYDTSLPDAYRLAGIYVGRILKGEKPSDLPVMQPTRFEFVINLKTAKILGLDIAPGLLAIADEVVE